MRVAWQPSPAAAAAVVLCPLSLEEVVLFTWGNKQSTNLERLPCSFCPVYPQVQAKLKLVGVEAVYLASSGERITRLDQLQDIDELHVVEVRSLD